MQNTHGLGWVPSIVKKCSIQRKLHSSSWKKKEWFCGRNAGKQSAHPESTGGNLRIEAGLSSLFGMTQCHGVGLTKMHPGSLFSKMQENCYGTSNSIAYGNCEAFLWQLRKFCHTGLPPPRGFSFTCTLNVSHHEDPDTRPDPSLFSTNTPLLHPHDHRWLTQSSSQRDQTCSGSGRETDELGIWQRGKPPKSHGELPCHHSSERLCFAAASQAPACTKATSNCNNSPHCAHSLLPPRTRTQYFYSPFLTSAAFHGSSPCQLPRHMGSRSQPRGASQTVPSKGSFLHRKVSAAGIASGWVTEPTGNLTPGPINSPSSKQSAQSSPCNI